MTKPILNDDLFRVLKQYEQQIASLNQANFQPRTAPIYFSEPGSPPDIRIRRDDALDQMVMEKLVDNVWVPTYFSGATPVSHGGTGGTTPATAREGIGAAGKYSSASHAAGTSISIPATTHNLGPGKAKVVMSVSETSTEVIDPTYYITEAGDVFVYFSQSQPANTIRTTIVG